jgi:hypothetical protein
MVCVLRVYVQHCTPVLLSFSSVLLGDNEQRSLGAKSAIGAFASWLLIAHPLYLEVRRTRPIPVHQLPLALLPAAPALVSHTNFRDSQPPSHPSARMSLSRPTITPLSQLSRLVSSILSLPRAKLDKFLMLRSSVRVHLTHLTCVTPWQQLSSKLLRSLPPSLAGSPSPCPQPLGPYRRPPLPSPPLSSSVVKGCLQNAAPSL